MDKKIPLAIEPKIKIDKSGTKISALSAPYAMDELNKIHQDYLNSLVYGLDYNWLNTDDISIESDYFTLTEKGEIFIVNILDLYKKRRSSCIDKKYKELRNEIIEEDEVTKIIQDAENQINVLLNRNENNSIKLINVSLMEEYIYTEKTKNKLEKLDEKRKAEEKELDEKYDELKSLFDLTTDYNERINILKKHKILDNNLHLKEED